MDHDSGSTSKELHTEDGSSSDQNAQDFSNLIKQGYDALMPAIRAANSLPKGQQWDLLCTSPNFKPLMDSLGKKTLELMALILNHQGMNRDIRKRDLEEKYELIVDANDKILERVGTHLDELSGIKKNPTELPGLGASLLATASGSWNRNVTNSARWKEVPLSNSSSPSQIVLRNARVTHRPQAKFHDKIDNSSAPFEPRIKEKPNALKPLAILLEAIPDEEPCYSHPYEFELDRFQEKIDSLNLQRKRPQPPKPIDETPLIIVSNEEKLMEMLEDLKNQSEIAVDLEHHSYRTFQGFTCLMQISTRENDYIVDTLELRHKLHVLNEVFTHPKIVKVFHGADSDIQWLQRDLSLYVVNMFDTYQASFTLSLPKLSLAYLLKTICNVDANKTFQLYDWRTRPLGKEAIKYAREDTHYLLYVYEVLWNRLLDMSNGGTQLLQTVLFRSADTCKKRYWKSVYTENSYEKMYHQSKKSFDNKQMYALKELYAWRDKVAREEDESFGYVLPNHMLLLIAEKLPKEMQGILACCNPIPPLVRQNLVLLHQIILKAREQPLIPRVSTEMSNENRVRPIPQTTINLEGALHCPHDLSHSADFRDDLPTLLNTTEVGENEKLPLMVEKPALDIFDDKEQDDNSSKMNLPNQIYFMSPFDRYMKMLVYIESDTKSKEDREKEIQEDAQRLLDECMQERLKSAAANVSSNTEDLSVTIKQEKQDYSYPSRKRRRSQSPPSRDVNISDGSLCITIKSESSIDEIDLSNHKMVTMDESFTITDENFLQNVACKMEPDPNKDAGCRPKSKKKKYINEGNKKMTMSVGIKNKADSGGNNWASSSDSFTQFDYSQVDYSQFQQSDRSTPQRTSHDKFKHKGKKKHQNRSFTFARQSDSSGYRGRKNQHF